MNEQSKRTAIYAGVALLVIGVAGFKLFFGGEDNSPPAGDGKTIYYTGPMKSKGGGGEYGTIDGKKLTEAEGKAAADQWLKEHPELNSGAAANNGQATSPEPNQVN